MACACNNRRQVEFVWTSADGSVAVTYSKETMARARVIRDGGSYDERMKTGG